MYRNPPSPDPTRRRPRGRPATVWLLVLALPLAAFAAASTLVIGAAYTLWLVKRVMYGEVANAHVAELKDINGREILVLGVFAVGVLAIGLWPKPLTDLMAPAIEQLAMQLANSKL